MPAPIAAPAAPVAAARPTATDSGDADRFSEELAAASSQLETTTEASPTAATAPAEESPATPDAPVVAPLAADLAAALVAGATITAAALAAATALTAEPTGPGATAAPETAPAASVPDAAVVAAPIIPLPVAGPEATAPTDPAALPTLDVAGAATPNPDLVEPAKDETAADPAEASTEASADASTESPAAPVALPVPTAPAAPVVPPFGIANATGEPSLPTQASASASDSSVATVTGAAAAPESPATLAPVVLPAAVPTTAPTATTPVQAPAVPARAEAAALVPQLVRPLQSLRSAGDGNHVLTISVTPETLGPVTVRAHVSGDHVRIELVAPTDQARDALRSILTDLRRDLAQGASSQPQSFSLDLSSGGGSGADRGTAAERGERSRPEFTASAAPAASDRAERPRGADSLLDVLA